MTSAATISAGLFLRRSGQSAVGADRIALLESILEHGSISGAAKAVGLSYKGAWDAVQALNNLFGRPLVASQAGGSRGGFAEVTSEGLALIQAFHALESELTQVLDNLERRFSDPASPPLHTLLWSLGMKSTARNALRGIVESVTDGAVNAEVVLKISPDARIVAIVTRQSVEDLNLTPGRAAIALINASFIIIVPGDEAFKTSARNTLAGTIAQVEHGAVNDEVTLDLGAGKTLAATVTHHSAIDLRLQVGQRASALIKASHVILAVE